jgi:hypothetical protein
VDYNPAIVGQLPNESTAVIIFERPDGDRNYVARDFAVAVFLAQAVPPGTDSKPPPKTMSRVARSIFSPCWEGSNPCASTRSSHLPDAFPPQSKSCAACSPRGWRPIAPGTGTSGSGVLRSVWRSCQGAAGAPSVPNVQIGMPRHRGPRVRIQFPPAQSLVRTFPSGSDRRNPPINRRQGRIGSCGPSTGRSEQRRPAREKTRRRCSARPRWSRRRCSNTTSSAPPVS